MHLQSITFTSPPYYVAIYNCHTIKLFTKYHLISISVTFIIAIKPLLNEAGTNNQNYHASKMIVCDTAGRGYYHPPKHNNFDIDWGWPIKAIGGSRVKKHVKLILYLFLKFHNSFTTDFLSWCYEGLVKISASLSKDWQTSSNLPEIAENSNFPHFFIRDPTKIANFKMR